MQKDWPTHLKLERFEMAAAASFFDGDTATEHRVLVEVDAEQLFFDLGSDRQSILLGQLVRLYSVSDRLLLGRGDRDGWRLIFDHVPDPAIAALLPSRVRTLTPPVSRKAAAIGFVASSLVIGLIASLFFAPHLAARQMPLSLERRIGDSVKFAPYVARCDNPEALASLEEVVDRLDPEARADGFTIELLGVDAVNAAALPGGRIVVLNGLIDEAGTADAIAGVLAHEIAHVRRHHVASQAIRQLGLASLVSVMGGGNLSATAGGLLALKFGREAEAEADADAIAMLERAKINPRPTAFLFDKMHRAEGNSPEWLASHPASDERAKAFSASYRKDFRYLPALSGREEDALFDACRWPYLRYGEQSATS